ncbi:MAG: polyprenyl diphosphate synthase [Candidatus Gastranaerophilales bacterium]|nr:polyprenyl diphosphate synthase [Candidatus Gastranaerophilales bacterium]
MVQTLEKENIAEIVKKTGLKHIAIIMDGNRRWAKENNLPSAMGHKKGVDSLKAAVKSCHKFGVKYLTVYAFSTENWNRNPDEVTYLMELFALTIKNELKELDENNVVIRFVGDLTKLNKKLQKEFSNAVNKTKNNTGVNLQIAINYGARDELVNAVKNIVQKGYKENEVTEELISKELYTSDIPDPDLLIRTGGEMRVSNYLLWQIAYSELLIIPQYWPEFDEKTMSDAIIEFNHRQRRYGA